MSKRVLLSAASPGLAAVDAALADLATDASGDGTKAFYGDGTFKTPAGGPVQSVTVSLSSAQLLALHTSPVTIVPAPGTGNVVVPLAWALAYTYGSTTYVSSDSGPILSWNNTTSPEASSFDITLNFLLTQTSSQFGFVSGLESGNTGAPSAFNNQPLLLGNVTSNMTTGNGTAKLTVWYSILVL
jgi:hypothetical protein